MPAHVYARLLPALLAVALFAGCKSGGERRDPFKAPGAQPPSDAVAESPAQKGFETRDTLISIAVRPQDIRLFWKDSTGEIFGSLGAVKRAVEARGNTLRFAMNGGMYTEAQGPLGLFIQEGKTLHRLNRDTGYGNFYLRPNGVFFITEAAEAGVCRTEDFPSKKNIRRATQSGPMLLVNGRVHPAFKEGSANLNIRNGVGIGPDGRVVLGISSVPVSLWDFAQVFKRRGCKNALYLDGAVSRAFYPAVGMNDTGGAFGVIIGVVGER